MRKISLLLSFTAVAGASFVFGVLASRSLPRAFPTQWFDLLVKKPFWEPAKGKGEAPTPEAFLQRVTLEEFRQFDQLYEQRPVELRNLIAQGTQEGTILIPQGIFAQLELIQSKIDFLTQFPTATRTEASVKESLGTAYQSLKETYEKEIDFLKNYPAQSQDIGFVTDHIFEITSKDQKSGLQFLDSLLGYRRLLAEAIREEEPPEVIQAKAKDLVTLNSLAEKYRTRLNVPLE